MSDHGRDDLPLGGRAALVTGVSRRAGIGFAIARRLAGAGASIFAHHHVPHDAERRWGGDPRGIDAVLDELRGARADPDAALADAGVDLADAARPIEWLVSDDGRWMTGQVLNSEGGFRRWVSPAD